MSRPTPLSGYPEWLPAQRAVEQQVVDELRRTFELHGFAGIETRAVEPMAQLLRKGEIDKEVYVVSRLHADADAQPESDDRRLGLHFDLTVPFARYVLENSGKLQFPFRRYQIQKVWRGERPQEGRYREFCQADIDVVGDGVLPFHHDIEVVEVMAEAMSRLPLPPLRMQVNNRKLVQGFYRGLGVEDVAAVLRAVDKLDKVGPDAVRAALVAEGHSDAVADACLRLAAISGTDAAVVEEVRALGVHSDELDEGLHELATLLDATGGRRGTVQVVAALKIARGLDYYTGTVMETVMEGYEQLGSISAGGRYDALASDGSTTYPGVGISFGVSRTLGPLLARGVLTGSRSTPSAVLVALASEEARPQARAVAAALRARGIACELAPAAQKYGKQIRQAERRGIPYVWFPAEATADGAPAVRDIRTGEQTGADDASWLPPDADLRPSVIQPDDEQGE
ncbi:histidine--tRNA ligase [Angustibacter luteus]|uniref:Histidine--tRNA ligase n=1 Tax=Angustibacter luteus TaxID=658456 RepID=A0ABW1J9Q1_9ACTN